MLPFGLTFQQLMEQELPRLLYLDDMIVNFPDFDSHLQRLEDVFRWLQDAGVKLKPMKCKLLQDEVHYLGSVVNSKGVTTPWERSTELCRQVNRSQPKNFN